MGEGIFDILGLKPGFNYKGQSRSSSNCGNLTGFFIVIFIIWAFYQVGQDILARKSPNVVSSRIFVEDPGQILIDPDHFIFALGLERPDNFAHYIDPGIYTLKAIHYNMKRVPDEQGNINLVFTDTELDLEVCNIDHFGSKRDLFDNLELKSLYCLKPKQSHLDFVDIKGKFEVDEVSFLRFKFSVCNNATSNNQCKPQEDIDFLLDGAYFAVYYTDTSIAPANFSQPERRYMDAQFTTFGKSYHKEYQIWVGHNQMTTDSGWLFQETEISNSFSYDFTKELLDFRAVGDQFFEFQIRVSPFYNYYTRGYIKIQEIIAEVEGLVTVVIVLVAILILPYIKIKFYEELIGDVFDVHASLDRNPKHHKHHNADDMTIVVPKAKFDGTKTQTSNVSSIKQINFPKNVEEKKMPSVIRQDSLESAITVPSSKTEAKKHENPIPIVLTPVQTSARTKRKNISLFLNKPETTPLFSPVDNKMITELEINSSLVEVPENKNNQDQEPTPQSAHLNHPEEGNQPLAKTYKAKVSFQDVNFGSEGFEEAEPRHSPLTRSKTKKKSQMFVEYGDMDENKFIYKSVANIADDRLRKGITFNMLPEDAHVVRQTRKVKTAIEAHKDKQFGISLIEYFRSFFSEAPILKKKMNIINEGKRRIVERLDVFNILKKMREIDKLKALLLDQEQLILFDCLPRPVIDYEEMIKDKPGNQSLGVLRDPEFVKIRQAVFQDAYQEIMKKKQKSEIDQKLIDIYDGLV